MNYQEILVEVNSNCATITLNRPETYNAINEQMHHELATVFGELDNDQNVKVIVLTGAGKAFSSGGDIEWMQKMINEPRSFDKTIKEGKKIIYGMLDCEKPIICKLNGVATGLGATIALFSDIIIASDTARIGDPHVSVGFVAGDGGAIIWPYLVGVSRAKEYLMTGELLSAIEAERIGLINHCVPHCDLDAKVEGLVERLKSGATKAIGWTKLSVNLLLKQAVVSVMDASLAYEASSNLTFDHQEAVNAFRERRSPVFIGK